MVLRGHFPLYLERILFLSGLQNFFHGRMFLPCVPNFCEPLPDGGVHAVYLPLFQGAMGQRLPLPDATVPCLPDEFNPPVHCSCFFYAGISLPERPETPALYPSGVLRGDVPQLPAVCLPLVLFPCLGVQPENVKRDPCSYPFELPALRSPVCHRCPHAPCPVCQIFRRLFLER